LHQADPREGASRAAPAAPRVPGMVASAITWLVQRCADASPGGRAGWGDKGKVVVLNIQRGVDSCGPGVRGAVHAVRAALKHSPSGDVGTAQNIRTLTRPPLCSAVAPLTASDRMKHLPASACDGSSRTYSCQEHARIGQTSLNRGIDTCK
jgi:hypothetical protein